MPLYEFTSAAGKAIRVDAGEGATPERDRGSDLRRDERTERDGWRGARRIVACAAA
jgi:hypothetical protein